MKLLLILILIHTIFSQQIYVQYYNDRTIYFGTQDLIKLQDVCFGSSNLYETSYIIEHTTAHLDSKYSVSITREGFLYNPINIKAVEGMTRWQSPMVKGMYKVCIHPIEDIENMDIYIEFTDYNVQNRNLITLICVIVFIIAFLCCACTIGFTVDDHLRQKNDVELEGQELKTIN